MKTNLKLPNNLLTLLERDAHWMQYYKNRHPVELQTVQLGGKKVMYLATIRIGKHYDNLYEVELNCGTPKTNLELTSNFCVAVELKLKAMSDAEDFADWYMERDREDMVRYTAKRIEENPLTGLQDALDEMRSNGLTVRDAMDWGREALEVAKGFLAVVEGYNK